MAAAREGPGGARDRGERFDREADRRRIVVRRPCAGAGAGHRDPDPGSARARGRLDPLDDPAVPEHLAHRGLHHQHRLLAGASWDRDESVLRSRSRFLRSLRRCGIGCSSASSFTRRRSARVFVRPLWAGTARFPTSSASLLESWIGSMTSKTIPTTRAERSRLPRSCGFRGRAAPADPRLLQGSRREGALSRHGRSRDPRGGARDGRRGRHGRRGDRVGGGSQRRPRSSSRQTTA